MLDFNISPIPWKAGRLQGDPTIEVRDAEGRVICEVRSPDQDSIAQLLATAPKLLAACEKVLIHWNSLHHKDREQIRQAVAEAKNIPRHKLPDVLTK
jgi:hypothetical protein